MTEQYDEDSNVQPVEVNITDNSETGEDSRQYSTFSDLVSDMVTIGHGLRCEVRVGTRKNGRTWPIQSITFTEGSGYILYADDVD
jgi:hypothetical protein